MSQWRERYADLGLGVAAITYDAPEVLAEFAEEEQLGYPLLSDVEAQSVIALGILNEDYEPGHRAYGIPHPGILLVDANGTVLLKRAVPNYRERPPFEELFEAVSVLLKE